MKRDFIPIMELDGRQTPDTVQAFFPPLMAGSWAVMREAVLPEGALPRWKKEVIAAFVSRSNDCTFCANAHTSFAAAAGAGRTPGIPYNADDCLVCEQPLIVNFILCPMFARTYSRAYDKDEDAPQGILL